MNKVDGDGILTFPVDPPSVQIRECTLIEEIYLAASNFFNCNEAAAPAASFRSLG
jgi:hypothetical protein